MGMNKELKVMGLKSIKPYENNPRKNAEAIDIVKKSIEQCGYIAPIVVDENMVILAGHTRYNALKELGRTECEVMVVEGLTDEQKRKYRLLDNKTNEFAAWDFELLEDELFDLDFDDLDIDWGIISPDDFGETFELPDGDKNEICQMSFTLHEKQAELIKSAMDYVKDVTFETFGNENKNGNCLYEVVREWAEQKKLL